MTEELTLESNLLDVVTGSDLVIVVKGHKVVVLRGMGDLIIEAPGFEYELGYDDNLIPAVTFLNVKPEPPNVEITGEAPDPTA